MRPISRQPRLLVSADWSVSDKKRWMARAERDGDRYVVYPPEPVGDPTTMIRRLRAQTGEKESALFGFDFPIGLPAAYAAKAGLSNLRDAFHAFTKPPWCDFYEISDAPTLHQPFAPLPKKIGEKGFNRQRIASALGFDDYTDLLRRCDRKTGTRSAAEILFYTLGGKQVGAAAIVGWRDVISPALDTVRLWPFDGDLGSLLAKPGLTIAEIYPGEAYHHLDVRIGSGTGRTKRRRDHRRAATSHIIDSLRDEAVTFTNAATSWFEWGFLEEDDFDAMLGLLSMILVVTGRRASGHPTDTEVKQVEGWILGQEF